MRQYNKAVKGAGRQVLTALGSLFLLAGTSNVVYAEAMSPAVQAKVGEYKAKLQQWSKDPILVSTLKEVNAKAAPKINNDQWKSLDKSDPAVKSFQTNEAGQLLTNLQSDGSIGKLFLRDKNGNLVAGSKKPAIFNISNRPAYQNAMRGKVWTSKKVKADPTTRQKSVQLSAPVISGGKVIGVLHTSVIAE